MVWFTGIGVHCQLIIVDRSHSRSTGISAEVINETGYQRLVLTSIISNTAIDLLLLDAHQILSISFKGEYRGAAVDGLHEYLTHNEKSFREGRYYAKFCSIVQSSGTGKSRMLTEVVPYLSQPYIRR